MAEQSSVRGHDGVRGSHAPLQKKIAFSFVSVISEEISGCFLVSRPHKRIYWFFDTDFYQRGSIVSYASAVIARALALTSVCHSVRLSVFPSVCHTPVFYQNDNS